MQETTVARPTWVQQLSRKLYFESERAQLAQEHGVTERAGRRHFELAPPPRLVPGSTVIWASVGGLRGGIAWPVLMVLAPCWALFAIMLILVHPDENDRERLIQRKVSW